MNLFFWTAEIPSTHILKDLFLKIITDIRKVAWDLLPLRKGLQRKDNPKHSMQAPDTAIFSTWWLHWRGCRVIFQQKSLKMGLISKYVNYLINNIGLVVQCPLHCSPWEFLTAQSSLLPAIPPPVLLLTRPKHGDNWTKWKKKKNPQFFFLPVQLPSSMVREKRGM